METTVKAPSDLVTVTVNGAEHQFPKGKNLLAALLDTGIQVPHYCWHPSLSISGNCRLCLVEIEGQPRPNVSCNMSCTEGLKIKTEGAMVEDCRKGMMEFLLVNHPLDCPICDRGGECQLQRYSMEYGTGHARTTDDRRRFEKPQFDPLIDIERNRCIMCTRCVRFMDEVAGEHLMAVYGRGNRNYIGTFGNGPVDNVFSGNVIDICPVGCLTSKPFRFKARSWELQQVVSTCTLCSAGCATTAWLRDGKLLRMTPPVRRYQGQYTIDEDTTGFICNEGRFGNYYVNHPDRLTKTTVVVDGTRSGASWQVALETAARALKSAAEEGPERVAILCGARATNEEYYLLSRLARVVLGTNQIDWRLGFTSAAGAEAAGAALLASDGDLDLLESKQYTATLVIGADLPSSTPVIGLKIKEAARLGQTRLGLLGPRLDHWLTAHAKAAVSVRPEAIASSLVRLATSLKDRSKAPADLAPLEDMLTGAESGLLVLGLDLAGGAFNAELVSAASLLLKQLGPGWEFLPVQQGRNGRGAVASGAQSDRLPGGAIDSAETRTHFTQLWGTVKAESLAGPSAPEILRRAARGEIKTLLLHRADELVNHPQRELIEKALAATAQVIVIDTFPSWISEKATVVLPGAFFFETEGSQVSADGTLQSLAQANQPPGDAQPDWRIIASLAEALGAPISAKSIQGVFGEVLASWDSQQRFRLDDLRLEGPGPESPQRAKGAIRRRTRPDFKLHGNSRDLPSTTTSAPAPVAARGLRLLWFPAIQGEDHLTTRSDEFANLRPEATIELNPADAQAQGLAAGSHVQISGCSRPARVEINPGLVQGIAYAGANFVGLSIGESPEALPEITLTLIGGPS